MKKYLALKASAGSGKTFALTARYISLLLQGAKPSEILTLTFTNKAANEMSERIFKTLLNLGDDKAYLEEIKKQSNLTTQEILAKKQEQLNKFQKGEISILTIDKFVNKILREFCGYMGISDDFAIKNDNSDELNADFLTSLNSRDLEEFVSYFIYEDKKLNSLFELFKLLIEKGDKLEVQNIENAKELIKLCEDEVLHYALKIKEELSCKELTASAQNALDFTNFKELQAKGKTWLTKSSLANFTYFKKYSTQTAEENFLTLQTHLENYYKLRSVYSLNNLLQLFFKFANFRDRYLKKKNYLEFNDISNLTHKLLNKEINRDFLYFRLDSIYNHLLIDEFQDTSLLQYKILSPIIEEICSGDQTEFKTFFYVGDIKQSIYRFRGGKRELFDFVAKKNSAVQTEVLNTNYRSSKEVVEFVNETFSDLPNYEYENQLSLKSGGFVCCQTAPKENLLDNIAQKIEELLSLGVSQDSIAILTHTNADVLNIYNHLEKTLPNIKVTTEMTSKLINQPNVKAVINAIKYLYFKEEIYKANCNAILGKELVCPIEFDEFILEKNITFIIKEIAQSFDILDENVLNFIEISNGFENIVDFIYEVDLLDTPIQSNQNSGVQIMTIFKSKGLEFDTVILLDKNSTNNSSEPLLFEYSDVELQNIYYKIKNLEFYDENYKQALQKELSLKRDDELNILYVALTRAKHNLIVLKNEEKSIFDVVNLSTFERGELLISKEQKTEIKLEQNLSYTPLNLGKQKLKIKQSNDEQDYSLHSKYFGLATHYCLEILSSFSVESLPKALQIVKSKYHNYLNSSDFEDINSRVTALLENSYFQSIVSNAAFSKEQSLLYKNELKIVDLLLFKDDRYYIFDYKTTKNEESSHIAQVSYYQKAIQDITSCKEIESCIIYLHKDSVEFKRVE